MNDPVVAYLFLGAVAWMVIVGAFALVEKLTGRDPNETDWHPGDRPWWRW